MDIRKHQNVLAVIYFLAGYFCAFCFMFTTNELHLQSFGGLMVIYYTWLITEQL